MCIATLVSLTAHAEELWQTEVKVSCTTDGSQLDLGKRFFASFTLLSAQKKPVKVVYVKVTSKDGRQTLVSMTSKGNKFVRNRYVKDQIQVYETDESEFGYTTTFEIADLKDFIRGKSESFSATGSYYNVDVVDGVYRLTCKEVEPV